MSIQVLRDVDGVYKAYYNEVERRFVEANATKWEHIPQVQVQCFPTWTAVTNRLGPKVELIDGGFKESDTVAPPISNEELASQLGRIAAENGVQIPETVLRDNQLPKGVSPNNFNEVLNDKSIKYANTEVYEPMVNCKTIGENRELLYLKACAKLSVAKKKEKELLSAYLKGFEDACTEEFVAYLLDLKKGFIND